jgi:hypothetical protein
MEGIRESHRGVADPPAKNWGTIVPAGSYIKRLNVQIRA